ncbi:MAG: DUF1080 domain-containing protein [Flavobacteriaceae bacterium]
MLIYKQTFFKLTLVFIFIFLESCRQEPLLKEPWRPLFDGQTLHGWTVKGGTAIYEVRNDQIVGTTVANTPNSFLTTNEHFSDFILELEYKVDPDINSGIQIRSNSFPFYQDGRVHGYQVEIDPSERAWSGGIYEEGSRGWLHPIIGDKKASSAFKQNDWNHYRIEAIGDTIRTWVNGVPASHLVDERCDSGFIGLQVHSIGDNQQEGSEINWRNIKIIIDSAARYSQKTPLPPVITKNRLLHAEAESGWQLLWDGQTTNGWRGAKSDRFPEKGWVIQDGELIVLASGGAESAAGGDIVTITEFAEFELMLEFKLTEGANSGIKYYVDTELNKGPGSAIGLEFQILDDARHPDAKLGNHEGSRTVGSLYDIIQASSDKHVYPIGEWNRARIISTNNHVEHWLNGKKVLEFERKSPEFRKLVSESKYKDWPDFGEANSGPLLLQDHGDRVAFKNIKIRPIVNESL